MAIITKIREKSGLAIFVVAIAMIAFILGADFLGRGFGGDGNQTVGEVDGKEIGYQAFINETRTISEDISRRRGVAPNEQEMEGIRRQVWGNYVFKHAIQPQIDELGLEVTEAEMTDLISGNNISPLISQQFTNPQTRQFDREQLNNFLQNYKNDPNLVTAFNELAKEVKKNRLQEKYFNGLANTFYATKAEAKNSYNLEKTKASFKYLYVPYASIADSAVQVSDSDLKDYYNKNKVKYDRDATRSIEYVSFELKPSAEDEAEIKREISDLNAEFASTIDDTVFVDRYTDGTQRFMTANAGSLPAQLDFETVEEKKVYGPFKSGNAYKLYKVTSVEDDSVYWMKASHILIKPAIANNDESKAEAKQKAQDVLKRARGDEDFATLARELSDGPTKTRGGDLGWFSEGKMVAPFNDAVIKENGTGVINKVVESDFGFHIINVTAPKTKKTVSLAVIEREIIPSQETEDRIYRKAGEFSKYKSREELAIAIDKDSSDLRLLQALNLRKDARSINNLSDAGVRSVVLWAYNDKTDVGSISEIKEVGNRFVIATLTDKTEDGIAPFKAVEQEVRAEVMKNKKAEFIKSKLANAKGSVEEIVIAYGNTATTNTVSDFALNGLSFKGVTTAPKTVGKIAVMAVNETSQPIADETGVLIIQLEKITPAVETADLTSYKNKIEGRNSAAGYKVIQAIEGYAGVKDYLYKLY
ncbi:MAG: peptidyl-prolyl cis-trans isomerase D [Arenicella sp.]|jgi:peptidyl-prolyl cis-trans isomerase D